MAGTRYEHGFPQCWLLFTQHYAPSLSLRLTLQQHVSDERNGQTDVDEYREV